MGSRPVGHVVETLMGKGFGFWKTIPPFFSEVYIYVAVYVFSVKKDLPRYAASLHKVVHPVKGLKQRGFSAAGRPYKAVISFSFILRFIPLGFKISVKKFKIFYRIFVHFVTSLLIFCYKAGKR